MASMKFTAPCHSYGGAHNGYSESHQESSGYSNYSMSSSTDKAHQSSYNCPAQNNQLGRTMYSYDGVGCGQARVDKSTNYYAQAQCAQPSPPIHVLEDSKVVKTMKRQESHKSESWTSCYSNSSSPTHATAHHSEFAMQKEEHMTGKGEQGWANKPSQCSGVGDGGQFGFGNMAGKVEQVWANKPNKYYDTSHEDKFGLGNMVGKVEQDWANKPNQYSNIGHRDQFGLGNMMGKVEQGWASKPNQYSNTGHRDQFGLDNTVGKVEKGWANQPNQFSDKGCGSQLGRGNMVGKVEQGWGNKPNQYSNTSHEGQFGLHNMVGKMEQGWAHRPNQFPNKGQEGQFGLGNTGKVEQDWANESTHYSSPTRGNECGLAMVKDDCLIGKMGDNWSDKPNQYSSPTRPNQHGQSMYKEQESNVYQHDRLEQHESSDNLTNYLGARAIHDNAASLGVHRENHLLANMDHGWAKSPTNIICPTQASHTGLSMHKQELKMEKTDHIVVNSPTRLTSPVRTNPYDPSMFSQYGYSGNTTNNGWANQTAKYSSVNQSDHKMYEEQQEHGLGQVNHNGASYGLDVEDDDEGVEDIMDEILRKYPAHNVSGGQSSNYATQNQLGTTQNNNNHGLSKQVPPNLR